MVGQEATALVGGAHNFGTAHVHCSGMVHHAPIDVFSLLIEPWPQVITALGRRSRPLGQLMSSALSSSATWSTMSGSSLVYAATRMERLIFNQP